MSVIFSTDQKYRFYLSRPGFCGEASYTKGPLLWILLKPDLEDTETEDGATLRKIRQLTESNGFDGCRIVSLYALLTTNLRKSAKTEDPMGSGNVAELTRRIRVTKDVIVNWGDNARLEEVEFVHEFLRAYKNRVWCFGLTPEGAPCTLENTSLEAELVAYKKHLEGENE